MKNLDFIISIDQNVPKFILSDPLKLNHLLFNLIGNAIKYTNIGYIKFQIHLKNINDNLILNYYSGIKILLIMNPDQVRFLNNTLSFFHKINIKGLKQF